MNNKEFQRRAAYEALILLLILALLLFITRLWPILLNCTQQNGHP